MTPCNSVGLLVDAYARQNEDRRYRRRPLSDEPAHDRGGGELAILARLAKRFPAIGDDAAVLANGLVASVDTLVEGLDWRPEWSSAADVGWKAVMVNASDIAAMGATVSSFLVSLVMADGFDVDAFFDGVEEACAVTGGTVVGGDLSAGPVTMVTVTVLGCTDEPVLRSGASPGDGVWVSGPVGAASRDLRIGGGPAHRRPTAYVGARPLGVTAMIDVSDGLVLDCARIAEASGVAVALDDVPVAPGATLDDALYGGDDYVLVACAPHDVAGWTRIGMCTAGEGITYRGEDVEVRGWEHGL